MTMSSLVRPRATIENLLNSLEYLWRYKPGLFALVLNSPESDDAHVVGVTQYFPKTIRGQRTLGTIRASSLSESTSLKLIG
jgi:hypothetical protein